MDKLINKCVLKGNDVLFLQDKVQSYSRPQVKSRSISEIFSTDISPIFTETYFGLCSWILANQQFTQGCDSFLCFQVILVGKIKSSQIYVKFPLLFFFEISLELFL